MSAIGGDLVGRAKKFRAATKIEHHSVANVGEALERWSKFLQEHETTSRNDCTHLVFDNYIDWWMGEKRSFCLAIAEDNTLEKLYACISQLYDLGIPLTLQEKQTPQVRFAQDIEIWGLRDTAVQVEELMSPERSFARLLGKIMGEIFKKESLDAMVFDSTGYSRTKGVMKTSVRLVWSGITVNTELATRIRDCVVHKFKGSSDPAIRDLGSKILVWNRENQWGGVFADNIYSKKFGVRMPLNDRVSPAPLKKPELRPFEPWGVLRYEYAEGEASIEKLGGPKDLPGTDWLKVGCIRRDVGSPLTQCNLPAFTPPSMNAISMSQRAPGGVRVRTDGGSPTETRQPARRTAANPQTEREIVASREFGGSAEEFRVMLETALGRETMENGLEMKDGGLTWRSDEMSVRIQFTASTRSVDVTGRKHQVRQLIGIISGMVTPKGESVRSTAMERPAASREGITNGGYTPSAVYAPSIAHEHSQVLGSTSSSGIAQDGGKAPESAARVVVAEFMPEGAGELALAVNDRISVLSDLEAAQRNVHHWVYGLNTRTQDRGWFPFNHTKPMPAPLAEPF